MRVPLLLLTLPSLSGCDQAAPPAPAPQQRPRGQAPVVAVKAPVPTAVQEAGDDARAMLRRYYDLIEAGRYADAWAIRGGTRDGADAFARNFAAYQSYRVTVGEPSLPVSAAGWSFVEVPVMITGTMIGGKGFGSAGSISLRRAAGAPGATAAQKQWHIYMGN